MDRDHIIRIVLEGKNNLSNVVRDMARDVDVQFKQIRNQWKSMDAEATKYARTMKNEVNEAHRRSGEIMGALRQRADALSLSLKRLRGEQEASNRARKEEIALFGGKQGTRGPDGRFQRPAPSRFEELRSRAREGLGGFMSGIRQEAEIRRELAKQLSIEGDAIETRKGQIRDYIFERQKLLDDDLDLEKEKTERAVKEILAKKRQLDIEAARELQGVKDKEIRAEVNDRIKALKDEIDLEANMRRREGARARKELKREAREDIRVKRSEDSPLDEASITRRVLQEVRTETDLTTNSFRRMSVAAGRSVGALGRGFLDGRRGLRALTVEGQKADNILARLGNTAGRATKGLGTLVNLRWFLLISALNLVGNLVAVIGANLVSLASSATLAAGALGGAFTAALGQGLVTLGLFKAAASSLGTVLDAVKIQEQERLSAGDDAAQKAEDQRSAIQRLADANWTLKLAIEGVTDAQKAVGDAEDDRVDALREQRRAVVDLAEARRDAARAIVDANFDERDAALSLEEAELAVLDAKQRLREEQNKKAADKTDLADAQAQVREAQERLRLAKEEGDALEIGTALSQLAIAEQNLGAIQNQIDDSETRLAEATTAVRRAELNQEQAAIRNKRAAADAAEARKKGVEGADSVVAAREHLRESNEAVADATDRIGAALRGVRDAVHAVTVARREQKDAELGIAEATNKQTAAQEDLQNRLADMTPAERQLFRSIVRIKKIYQEQFGPITDIIIGAYARAVDRAAELLQDPKIMKAAKGLATAIAGAIDTISKFTLTPEFRKALTQFLDDAAKNVPLLTRALLALLRVFLRLGTAGAPLFRGLLDRFVGQVERLEKATRDPQRLERFFATASRHLDAWLALGKAVGGVLGALIPQAAGASVDDDIKGPPAPGRRTVPPGPAAQQTQGILPFFTEKLNDAQNFFEENPDAAADFFDRMNEALQNLAPILGRTIDFLFEAFTSDDASAFSRVILETVIPGLGLLVKFLGFVSKGIVFLLDLPIIGDMVKWGLAFLVAEKALNRIFPVSQKVTEGLKKLIFSLGKGLVSTFKYVRTVGLSGFFDGMRLRAMYAREAIANLATNVKTLATRAFEAGKTIATNFYNGLKNAATQAAALGRNSLKAAKEGLVQLATRAKQAAIAVGTALYSALRTAALFVAGKFVAAIRLLGLVVRTQMRLIVGATGIGLLLVAIGLIYEHWDKIGPKVRAMADAVIRFLRRVVDWIRENWKKIAVIMIALFTFPVGPLALAIIKFKDRIIGVFEDLKDGIINAFRKAFKWVREKLTDLAGWVEKKISGIPLIGRLVGGGGEAPQDALADASNRVLESGRFDPQRKRIKALRANGMTGIEILQILVEEGVITPAQVKKLVGRQVLAKGGVVHQHDGAPGAAVPIIAHAGEWVLNKVQQSQVLKRLNMTADEAKSWLFGGASGEGKAPKKGKTVESHRGNHFNLTTQIDDDGNAVRFIEMDDGAWGQISKRSFERIKATNGRWIPPHVLRSTHGFTKRKLPPMGIMRGFAGGGIVQSFAMGGVVQGPGGDITTGAAIQTRPGQSSSKTVQQEFNVKAEGTMDWNYIMRLGAMRAQEV